MNVPRKLPISVQIGDISLEEEYAGICGITQTELEATFQSEIQVLATLKPRTLTMTVS